MSHRPVITAALILCAASVAHADLTIVDEDFESYTSNTELYAVWGPENAAATLVDETTTRFLTLDDLEAQDVGARAFPEGGQAVEHTGGTVLEYQSDLNGGAPLLPSETQSIVLQGDIYNVGNIGNARLTIGLRSNAPENLVEIGHYIEGSQTNYRAALFPPTNENPGPNPNWQEFILPVEYDFSGDGVTNLWELFENWHRFRATITPHSITYEIDLKADGLDATGAPGWDVSQTEGVSVGPNGFDSFRFGGASNLSSQGNNFYAGMFFDNISLKLVDVTTPVVGDYNGDGAVDAADYTVWRDTLSQSVDPGTGADGNLNGVIDNGDYDLWVTNYGQGGAPLTAAGAGVPEPASLAGLLAMGALVVVRRRRR